MRELPCALYFGRHDPQVRSTPRGAVTLDTRGLIGFPVAHVKRIGGHARAGFHVQNRRAQFDVQFRQQKQRDDRGFGIITGKNIRLLERRPGSDPLFFGIALGQLDHIRVVFDAVGARAPFRSGDHRAPIAGTQVIQRVLRRELHHVEHFVHQRLRGGHPHHVLAGLPDFGRELTRSRRFFFCRLRPRRAGEYGNTQHSAQTPEPLRHDHKSLLMFTSKSAGLLTAPGA